MAYTLSKLLQDIYLELGQLQAGAASGGNSAALQDASLAGLHADDKWKGGALFISHAAGSAPEDEFAAVSAYVAAAGEFTLASSLSASIQAGDGYGVATAFYPLETMIELANASLRALGDIPRVDAETLMTSEGSSFAATLDWARRRPLRIDYLAIPGLSAIDPWRTVYDWDFVPAAPGGAGTILFADALPAGRPLRIWYQAAHPSLRAYGDLIAEALAPELAVAAGVERAVGWQHARQGGGAALAERWAQAQQDLAAARRAFPLWRPARRAKMLSVSK